MAGISSVALSGLNAAQTQLQTSAHNIANTSTPNFRRQEVVQSENQSAGVSATVRQAQNPGPSLETDVVNQLQAKNAFLANLAVFKTNNRLAGALLDKSA